MKKIILLTVLFFGTILAFSQPTTVQYDDERNYFNENQPLPVEKQMLFTGNVNPGIEAIEISFYNSVGKDNRSPLYTASWKKPTYKTNASFDLPINYKLRASSEYDIRISFYRPITDVEKLGLKRKLYSNMDAFINLTFEPTKKKIKVTKSGKQVVTDLNQVVENGLRYFTNLGNIEFYGFSDIILEKVKRIQGEKLSKNKRLNDSSSKEKTKVSYRETLLQELKILVHSELEQLLNTRWAVLVDTRYIDDYPTKKTQSVLAVNGGYGGVFMTGIDSLSFGGSPYVGVSFPFGKKAMASPFWSNTSLNVGVFINNFKDDSGVELTGPIFKRPYYIGLGYKAFQFIRFNAGATILEDVNTAGLDISGLNERVAIRPFVGISAEINLWTSFAK